MNDFARMNAGRIVVNTPSTEGAIGGIYNGLSPSLTLACGTGAGNLSTDNITVEHLLNIHRVARRRLNPRWASVRGRPGSIRAWGRRGSSRSTTGTTRGRGRCDRPFLNPGARIGV